MKKYKAELFLFFLTFFVYWISTNGEGAAYNYHVRLAAAMLQGRLDYGQNIPWFEIAEYQGKYFTVFPPMPAILLLPFVAIFGEQLYQPYLSIFFGALSVPFAYHVLLFLNRNAKIAFSVAFLYGLGTITWFHSQVGSGWYAAQIVGLAFSWIGLFFGVVKNRPILSGLAFSAAYLARVPCLACSAFVFLFYWHENQFKINRELIKKCFLIGVGLLPGLIVNGLYNYLRFGKFNNEAYNVLFLKVQHEPWYQYGHLSWHYIPTHLKEMFFSMPRLIPKFPYIAPSSFALAFWITTPAFIYILRAPASRRLVALAFLSLILAAIPSLLHGGNGFTQFGYRHTLDYMPYLIILTAYGMRGRVTWFTTTLIALSLLVNLWGVVTISHMHIFIM